MGSNITTINIPKDLHIKIIHLRAKLQLDGYDVKVKDIAKTALDLGLENEATLKKRLLG